MRKLCAPIPMLTAAESANIGVNATATVYTKAYHIGSADEIGVAVIASSATGTADIKVEIEQGYRLPTTEGAADATRFAEPDGYPDIFTQINDDNQIHIKEITPVLMPYIRFKITGQGSNPADTIVNVTLTVQEQA